MIREDQHNFTYGKDVVRLIKQVLEKSIPDEIIR